MLSRREPHITLYFLIPTQGVYCFFQCQDTIHTNMNIFCTKQFSSTILKHSCKLVNSSGPLKHCPLQKICIPAQVTTMMSKPINPYSTNAPVLSKTERLKQAFKDYGSTVLMFHIGMSLCSLGVWYLVVSR